MKSDIISNLNTLYKQELKGDIWTGIPVLIISFLCGLYAVFGNPIDDIGILTNPPYIQVIFWLQFLSIGLISADEFEGARFVISDRVSTPEQKENADFDDRLQPIRTVVNKECNGQVVREITGAESGATMDREDLDKILEMAESDDFDVLAVRDLDRLSRASPWETIDYLNDLREAEIILYEHPRQFFAWDDLNDFQLLTHKLFFSREWYQRLKEGRIEGVHRELEAGRWPFKPHFGYEKDEDKIYLDDSKGPILYRIFEIYEQSGNFTTTQDEINDRFGDDLEKELTKSRIRTVLTSKLCIGKLAYEGVVKNEIPALAAVPEHRFKNVQSVIESNSRTPANKIPEPIVDVTSKFGIEYAQSILEQISFRRCKECGGELEPYSTTKVQGIPVEKVQCLDCGYDGPLLSARDLREIHQTAPLRCPFCYQSEYFEVEKSAHWLDMYEYSCENCSHRFHADVGPNKYRRYQNNPDMGIDIHNNIKDQGSEHETKTSNETPRQQSKLTDHSLFS